MRRWFVYGGVVVAIVLAVWLARWNREARGRQSVDEGEGDTEDSVRRADAPLVHFAASDGGPLVDRKRRDEILAVLRAMYADATTPGRAPGAPDDRATRQAAPRFPTMPDGPEKAHYIRDRVRSDFIPLGLSCYASALEKDPALGGRVMIKFRIVGDPSVGGVVDEAEIDHDGGTIEDPKFLECLSQSMQSVVFDAPPHGGYVTVDYPLEFSPDDPPEGGTGSGAK